MKSVHLMGIGGTGMVSLAGLFLETGWKVRGSDQKIYPPASTELARLKIEVREGFSAKNLDPVPDLVVVGNVISRSNPEAQTLLQSSIPYVSMPEALQKYFLEGRRRIVVVGTHGKTTTTSLLAHVFHQCGRPCGLFVGGIPLDFGRGYFLGTDSTFVIEGDEYDTAFFEKTPKFLHYKPDDLILTSIEFDHADIYRDLDHVTEQFQKLIDLLPPHGSISAYGDSELVRTVCSPLGSERVHFYGFDSKNDWRPVDIQVKGSETRFTIQRGSKRMATVHSPLPGRHNILNALGVVAMAERFQITPKDSAAAIASFRGIKRRQELVAETNGIKIYDDFAHHPTAIRETLSALVPIAEERHGRLWAVFEPRSNTLRRRVFQDVLPESFLHAWQVVLAPVYRKADSLSAPNTLDPAEVARSISSRGGKAVSAPSHEKIVEMLLEGLQPGDVVVFMSNGDFGGLPARFAEALRKLSANE